MKPFFQFLVLVSMVLNSGFPIVLPLVFYLIGVKFGSVLFG